MRRSQYPLPHEALKRAARYERRADRLQKQFDRQCEGLPENHPVVIQRLKEIAELRSKAECLRKIHDDQLELPFGPRRNGRRVKIQT